jgi:hypothetical protein
MAASVGAGYHGQILARELKGMDMGVMHRSIGTEWEHKSLCGKRSTLKTGEDVTPRTTDASRVTCKICQKMQKVGGAE